MEEKKTINEEPTQNVKIVGGHKPKQAGEGVKILGSGRIPEEVTTLDSRPEPKE